MNNNNRNNGFNGNYNSGCNNGFDPNNNNDFNNYYEYKRDPNVPYQIYRQHPDARIATKKDGLPAMITATILLIVFGIISGMLIFYAKTKEQETERIIGYNVTVEGTVTDTWTKRVSSGKSTTTKHYAKYRYLYNYSIYFGTTEIGSGSLVENQKVTVYVDPNNPSDSRIFHENNVSFYAILAAALITGPFALFWIIMLVKFIHCCQGRMVIYRQTYGNNKKNSKKIWKKIK